MPSVERPISHVSGAIRADATIGKKVLTMAEYIEREALMVALCKEIVGDGDYYNGKDDMQDQIRDMVSRFPAADVTPVRHGRWLPFHSTAAGDIQYCSACEIGCTWKPNYCPNCGAKMDGDTDAT